MRGALAAIWLMLAMAGGAAIAQEPHGAAPENAPAVGATPAATPVATPVTSGASGGTPVANLPAQPRMPDAVAAEYGYGVREVEAAPATPPAPADSGAGEQAIPGGRLMIFTFIVAGLIALGVMVMAAARAWRQRDEEAEAH